MEAGEGAVVNLTSTELRMMSREQLAQRVEAQQFYISEMLAAADDVREDIKLTPAQRALFAVFMANPGRLMTRPALLAGYMAPRPLSDEPEIKIIDTYVCHMRKALKGSGFRIETVWGRGYRLVEEGKAVE